MSESFFTDKEIEELLAEPKQVMSMTLQKFTGKMKSKKGHGQGYMENHVQIPRHDKKGETFHVIGRRGVENPMDFSAILGYSKDGGKVFKLRRYNGMGHEHTNVTGGPKIYGFHIHTATERYQKERRKEETYAETTDRYADFYGALQCLVDDCHIHFVDSRQKELL